MPIVNTTQVFTSNTTLARDQVWTFETGGYFEVDGCTLRIEGSVIAGYRTIFILKNGGKITGLRRVCPEWWGAGSGAANNAPYIQAAINCMEDAIDTSSGPLEMVLTGPYPVTEGVSLTPSSLNNLHVTGGGGGIVSRLIAKGSTWAADAAVVTVHGRNDVSKTSDFELRGFAIVNEGSTARIGLQVGDATDGYDVQGQRLSLVEDVVIHGFPVGVLLQRARLVKFHRLGVWLENQPNGVAVRVRVPAAAVSRAEVGDSEFENCEFAGPMYNAANSAYGVETVIETSAIGGIQALRFDKCIFHKFNDAFHLVDGTSSTTQNGYRSNITDIWITNCQMDGPCGRGVLLKSNGSSTNPCWISNVHIFGCYFQGSAQEFVKMESPNADNQVHLVKSVFVSNNWSNGGAKIFLDAYKAAGLTVTDNQISDLIWANGPAIEFHTVQNVVCTGNLMRRQGSQTVQYMVQVDQPSDWYVIANNNSGGCATAGAVNAATGANRVVQLNV
ncbi:hypothetical protein AS593_22745 [Caulobacter vibrioides]|nr:hypothetical protein AS593_22745 [Caulobacter vibrioides]